jgi:hypothetical protein
MAVTSVVELDIAGERDLNESLEGGHNAYRTFIATTNDPTDTESTVLAHVDIPTLGELFPGSSIVYCNNRNPSRPWKDRTKWRVRCSYKSDMNQNEIDRITTAAPLDRRTKVSGQFRTVLKPARRCLRHEDAYKTYAPAGFSLRSAANSASDPLDPPIEIAVAEAELRFSKNVAVLPDWFANVALNYHNGVNDDDQEITILGTDYTLAKGTAKLGNFAFSEINRENGTDFVTITWSVTVSQPRELVGSESEAPSPWDVERLDEGMRKRVVSGTETIWANILDENNTPLMLPVPFDGDGDPITVDGTAIPEDELYWFLYRPFGPQVDFSVIPWT